jgi:hypothetical protein
MDELPVSDLDAPATRRSSAPRLLGAMTALLLVVAVVAAVVVNGNGATPKQRLASAATAVQDEPFAFELRMSGGVAASPLPIEFMVSGAVDPATKRTRAEMDLGALLPAGSGAPSKLAFIADGDVLYLQLPAAAAAGAGGKPWMKVDASSLTKGLSGGSGALPSSTNPLDSFEKLRAVDAKIEDLGTETVRGTKTTHFRTHLDLAKAITDLPADRRPPIDDAVLSSFKDVPADVWLDDQDRPRRQQMRFDLAGAGQPGTLTMTVEAFDYGKAVDIEVPPADQVTDAPGMFGGLLTGS